MSRLLLSSIITLSVLSSNAQEAVPLEQGKAAPFTGILLTPKAAQDLKNAVIERDGLVEQKASYERSMEYYRKSDELQQKKLNIVLEQNDKLALRLGEERSMSTWEKIGYFSLGIIATGIAGYAIGNIKTSN
jgi:hypothetical protein